MFHRGFKHSKTIKALGLRPRAFISFLVFKTPMKHSHSFLKYYFPTTYLKSLLSQMAKLPDTFMHTLLGFQFFFKTYYSYSSMVLVYLKKIATLCSQVTFGLVNHFSKWADSSSRTVKRFHTSFFNWLFFVVHNHIILMNYVKTDFYPHFPFHHHPIRRNSVEISDIPTLSGWHFSNFKPDQITNYSIQACLGLTLKFVSSRKTRFADGVRGSVF